jgi:hypothetical protein
MAGGRSGVSKLAAMASAADGAAIRLARMRAVSNLRVCIGSSDEGVTMRINVWSAYESYDVGACMTDATCCRTRVHIGCDRRRGTNVISAQPRTPDQ